MPEGEERWGKQGMEDELATGLNVKEHWNMSLSFEPCDKKELTGDFLPRKGKLKTVKYRAVNLTQAIYKRCTKGQ